MIITITLNPAFDIHINIPRFLIHEENYAKEISKMAGGKGINTSRTLLALGATPKTFALLGKDNEAEFLSCLDMPIEYISVDGAIRENITIHENQAPETRISADNFSVTDDDLQCLFEKVLNSVDKGAHLVISGRLPLGADKNKVISFLQTAKEKGAYIVVDSNSFTADDLRLSGANLIKPNLSEAKALSGKEEIDEILAFLYEKTGADILLSLGKDGAIYKGSEIFIQEAEKITPVSTIGAGDATLAGFLYAKEKGMSVKDALSFAVAVGTAKCLEEGTNPPKTENIKRV